MNAISHILTPLFLALVTGPRDDPSGRVEIVRTPNGGIQPQAVVDTKGTIHLLFRASPQVATCFYARRTKGGTGFLLPIRVNSTIGIAVAVGTVRGGQIALGRNERVHVVWNGASNQASGPDALRTAQANARRI